MAAGGCEAGTEQAGTEAGAAAPVPNLELCRNLKLCRGNPAHLAEGLVAPRERRVHHKLAVAAHGHEAAVGVVLQPRGAVGLRLSADDPGSQKHG